MSDALVILRPTNVPLRNKEAFVGFSTAFRCRVLRFAQKTFEVCGLNPYNTLMAATIRVAVAGTGSLGKEHVRIYAELARAGQVELAGVFDTAAETAQKVAGKHGARVFASLAEAAAASDALSIVTPTTTHYTWPKPPPARQTCCCGEADDRQRRPGR